MEDTLNNWKERMGRSGNIEAYDGLDMDPDFQRGHVWTEEQQIRFVEYALRGGRSGRDIFWNNPTWMGKWTQPTVLVDGKQRLNAALRFMHNEIPAFGYHYKEWSGRLPSAANFTFHVNTLKTRAEVLRWYLDINAGGTPHTKEELDRVRGLLDAELSKTNVDLSPLVKTATKTIIAD